MPSVDEKNGIPKLLLFDMLPKLKVAAVGLSVSLPASTPVTPPMLLGMFPVNVADVALIVGVVLIDTGNVTLIVTVVAKT